MTKGVLRTWTARVGAPLLELNMYLLLYAIGPMARDQERKKVDAIWPIARGQEAKTCSMVHQQPHIPAKL
eukprot:3378630-Amphidinium_carterae.1